MFMPHKGQGHIEVRVCVRARTIAKDRRYADKENQEQDAEMQRQTNLCALVHLLSFVSVACARATVSVRVFLCEIRGTTRIIHSRAQPPL